MRIRPGSTVALVGESGSGKSVTAQAIMGILPRTAHITGGEILFNDPETGARDLAKLPPRSKEFTAIRGNRIGMIFQEPMTSFSPLHTIGDQIGEALSVHREGDGRGEARAHDRDAAARGVPAPGGDDRHLSVRAVRRPAPARDDRDGADLPPGACSSPTSRRPRST